MTAPCECTFSLFWGGMMHPETEYLFGKNTLESALLCFCIDARNSFYFDGLIFRFKIISGTMFLKLLMPFRNIMSNEGDVLFVLVLLYKLNFQTFINIPRKAYQNENID